MKEKIVNIIKLFILTILFFNVNLIFKYIFEIIGFSANLVNTNSIVYLNVLRESTLLILIVIFYKKYLKKDLSLIDNKQKFISEIFSYLVLFMIVKIISAFVTSIMSFVIGNKAIASDNQGLIESLTNTSPVLMFISSVIFAPIVEEGLFRLSLRKVVKNKYIFMIISGFVFGLMHIFPTDLPISVALTQGIVYCAAGVSLAYIYVESDNIWYAVTIHAINNLLTMLLIIFM